MAGHIFPQLQLDRQSTVPLHMQLRQQIRSQINKGLLPAGAQLASVQEMTRRYQLSISTVTRALSDLAEEGVLVIRHGAGCFVGSVQDMGIEVFILKPPEARTPRAGFHEQILVGLRKELGDTQRRFWITYLEGTIPTGSEFVRVSRARNSQGLIVYRPVHPELVQSLQWASVKMPVVSLLARVPASRVDAVLVDTRPAFRSLLEQRLGAGQKKFLFSANASMMSQTSAQGGAYRQMLETYQQVLKEADLEPVVQIYECSDIPQAYQETRRLSANLAEGTTVITISPQYSEHVGRPGAVYDLIAYTEFNQTVAEFQGRVTMLYLSLETAARAAVRMIHARLDSQTLEPVEIRWVHPLIVPLSLSPSPIS